MDDPWGQTPWGVIHFDVLEEGSPEKKFSSGGVSFIWRFVTTGPNKIVFSDADPDGGFIFRFKVYDPDWEPTIYFIWAVVKRQDIAFATNAPDLYKWLIEATTGDTTVRSAVFEEPGGVSILTWEIDPLDPPE